MTTPIYGIPYAGLNDPPHGPNQQQALAEATESALSGVDTRVATLEGNRPLGVLDHAEVTTSQTGISAEVDLTGLSVTVTVGTGRWVRVTGHAGAVQQNTSAGTIVGRIKEGTTNLGRFVTTTLGSGDFDSAHGAVVLTPSPGQHTYNLAALTTAGTCDVLADAQASQGPAYIVVEDLGAV